MLNYAANSQKGNIASTKRYKKTVNGSATLKIKKNAKSVSLIDEEEKQTNNKNELIIHPHEKN